MKSYGENSLKHVLSVLVLFIAVFTSMSAEAAPKTRGRWLCRTCELAPPLTAMKQDDLSDVTAFIEGTVNTEMNEQAWQTYELITICDGSSCLTLEYLAGKWIPTMPTFKDSGQGYKNGQITKKIGANSDHATPIGSWYVWSSYFDYTSGSPVLRTPSVTVIQDGVVGTTYTYPQAESDGLGGSFSLGFMLNADQSSYDFGGDMMAGGKDLYSAMYGGPQICQSYNCGVNTN